jgi:phosphate transport system protein
MTKQYQQQIDKLKDRILYLSGMVEENLLAAVKAITSGDMAMARKVATTDDEIDRFEVEVEEECLKILALYQPVAIDLRFVIAVIKINNDLERIGDLAVNIAQRALTILQREARIVAPWDLPDMVQKTVAMVRRSLDALVEMNSAVGLEVCQMDDIIDRHHRDAFRAIEAKIKEDPDSTELLICLLGVSRNLERIADHATNIAEDVIYMVDGEIVRHRVAELDE